MAKPAKRFGLDLTYPLAGDVEMLGYLFEIGRLVIPQAEPHLEHFLLSRRKRMENLVELLMEEFKGRLIF